ncbi:tyrosine-type recombinase/integrase [Sulfitobacter sp. JBTF-M27]|uniref:Tyrosine-type recombinase/integrase n=1 Tax=Sulfitobacter sediminilitoris TaxID=2698830 RepID=A0A6P0CAI3_9RHOB|nr:tyrosine-type recombinase/integrase [Sulfitobacter sediminilitoris]NEK22148.1 tyrosine-type recombinase/integrase [Sulfitobacter sediminilitoris]
MQTKISQRVIAGLDATGKRQFIRDSDLVGFGIEGSAKGKFSYFVETRVKGSGKSVRTHLGNVDHIRLDDARQEARKLLMEAKRGTDIRFRHEEEEPLPETLGKAHEEFYAVKKHKLAPSTLADYRKTFNNCLADWKQLPTRQLSRRMVQQRYIELLDEKNPAYVNKVFRNLSSVLNFSGVRPNPCEVISDKDLRVQVEGKSRFLSGMEIHDVMQWHFTFRPRVTSLLLFYMLTGVRREEALGLTWADIREGKVHFPQTKNKKAHFVPLVGILNGLVGERRPDDEKVFPFTNASLRTALDKFKAQVKFREDWTIHDLRRTFSEHMNLIGYGELDIAVANNQGASGVTRRHYLSGQLAKENLLNRMFEDLQRQFEYYYREIGGEVKKVPKDWVPTDILIDEDIAGRMTNEDWDDYASTIDNSREGF